MDFKNLIIEVKDGRVKVILDGKELKWLTAINFEADIEKPPRLSLTANMVKIKNDCCE